MRFFKLDRITPPAALPVTPEEFIEHARIGGITVQRQPSLLNRELGAATRRGEEYCRRSFMTQTLAAQYLAGGARPDMIELPRGTVQAVSSIVAVSGGAAVDPGAYEVNLFAGVITFSGSWPSSAVQVEWISGYGDAAKVPDQIREGILEYATVLYGDRRGSREIKATADVGAQLPPGVEDLWSPFRVELSY